MASVVGAVEATISDLPVAKKFALMPVMCNKCAKNIWLWFFYGVDLKARVRAWGFNGIFKNDTRCEGCQEKR